MRGLNFSSLGVRPPLWREARIGLEEAALLRDPIFRSDGMPDGRGRPVLLIPGFLAGDGSLAPMAGWLKRAGYRPSRAGIVSNVNCAGVLMPRARGAAAGRRPAGLGLFEERRHRGMALLPRPARHGARGDQGLALRNGGLARGLASGRRRARELPRSRRAPPPGR